MPTSKHRLLMAAFGLAAIFIVFLTFEQSRRPAPRYTVTDLGVLPGYTYSQATAINSRGDVLISNSPSEHYTEHASLYQGGKLHDLGALPGASDIYVYGINSHGDVTGSAFIGRGLDINDRGEIVGRGLHHGQIRAFLLTPVR